MQAHCVPPCAEDKIGIMLYRYMITNIATLNGVDILMTLLFRLLGMAAPCDPATVGVSNLMQTALRCRRHHGMQGTSGAALCVDVQPHGHHCATQLACKRLAAFHG